MKTHAVIVKENEREYETLEDILPEQPGLRILFVGKTPARVSVNAGHYFQGKQGRMFWNKLLAYGILVSTTEYEDDSLLENGFGITDIVKKPRSYGDEPSDDEYRQGLDRILNLIAEYSTLVVVFVYKAVLDKILKFSFGIRERSLYGFNPSLDDRLGCKVFVFPMPGTPCKKDLADCAMTDLVRVINK